jgi:tripartite-type tricarboxylate transporter receptor subunit TctC
MRVYAALSNLASAHEQGLADFEAPTWFAVFLPRGASEPIICKLNQAAFATADTPSVQEHLNTFTLPSREGSRGPNHVTGESTMIEFNAYVRNPWAPRIFVNNVGGN